MARRSATFDRVIVFGKTAENATNILAGTLIPQAADQVGDEGRVVRPAPPGPVAAIYDNTRTPDKPTGLLPLPYVSGSGC